MPEEKTLFERSDELNDKLDRVLGILEDKKYQTLNNQQVKQLAQREQTKHEQVKLFFRQSRKSWRWFGTKAEFKKAKTMSILSCVLLLAVGFATSIISTICFRIYSTFTFFENIWMIFIIFELVYASHAKYIYETQELAKQSNQIYRADDVGMMFPVKTKKKYTAFLWFSFISIIANIICVWTMGKSIKGLATVFEILFLGAMIFALLANTNLFAQYSVVWVEGKKLGTGERIVLALPPGVKQLITEEEFIKNFPMLNE